ASTDQGFRERFEREAHIAALLRSPYTVHLLDFGVDAGQYLLVMEFVEGESLASILERGPIEPDVALQVASEVARALEEAAARGVVHRDIKPDNILVEGDGRVKVADFGIARQSGGGGQTQVGAFVGTAAYAAPEQVEGEADARTDIYSLGATLYCMLAGEPPYRGRTAMELMLQHRTTSLPMAPLSALPDIVQNIVRRCLEKDPRDRYSSPSELASALERARATLRRLHTEPPPPLSPPPGYVSSGGTPTVAAAPVPQPQDTAVAAPSSPNSSVGASRPGTAGGIEEKQAGSDQTVVPAGATGAEMAGATVPPNDVTGQTLVASAPPVAPTVPAVQDAKRPEPEQLAAAPGKRRRKKAVFVGLSVAIIAAGAVGAALLLANAGGTNKPTSGASPTAAIAANASATGGPRSTPAAALPVVFPPASAHFSILKPGAAAKVVDSPAGADGQCPVTMWTQPSAVASASNTLVQHLCTGDAVTIGAQAQVFAEDATWWQVTADKTQASGWVKEVTADGSQRFLALRGLQFTAPDNVIDTNSTYTAIIMTPDGSMTLELYADQSPRTVNNFVFLSEKGFYDGTTFFHVVKSLIEGGDPTGTGNGDAGYQLAVEGNDVRNVRGAIVMSSVVGQFGSKFFIYTTDNPSLDFDGSELTKVFPFGKVTQGFDVLDKIAATQTDAANIAVSPVTITNIVIEQRPK